MRIAEAASAAGVGVSTLRFYERRGLLAPTARTRGNYRDYDDEAVRRVRFIRRAQQLGFTLVEVEQFLALPDAAQLSLDDVTSLVAGKIDEIDRRIRDLERVRQALLDVARNGATGQRCPVLAALADA